MVLLLICSWICRDWLFMQDVMPIDAFDLQTDLSKVMKHRRPLDKVLTAKVSCTVKTIFHLYPYNMYPWVFLCCFIKSRICLAKRNNAACDSLCIWYITPSSTLMVAATDTTDDWPDLADATATIAATTMVVFFVSANGSHDTVTICDGEFLRRCWSFQAKRRKYCVGITHLHCWHQNYSESWHRRQHDWHCLLRY